MRTFNEVLSLNGNIEKETDKKRIKKKEEKKQ